ncbi:MAG: glycoside hydrolase family 15 protein [Solirubrobacteraceae bacterium]|nr:glycoside hydrolase family 15 protein [Patulibacter sp.]
MTTDHQPPATTDHRSPHRTDGRLPIEQYAVISDGRTAGLVGTDGSIDWWCVPALDAPPVFDRLLDAAEGGRFSIQPVDAFSATRRYRESSNVLETELRTASGLVRITDSLNSGHAGRLPWSELARRIEGLEGEVDLEIVLSLGTRFGLSEPRDAVTPNDGAFQLGPLLMQLRVSDGVLDEGEGDGTCSLRLRSREGSRETVALLATDAEPLMDSDIDAIDVRIDRSDAQWRAWADDLTYDGPYRERVIRSALALKLLLFSPTGAIAAAATTSLPEAPGGEKNYDYRLAWVRDVAYSVKALLRIGATEEAQAGFAWLMEALHRHLPQLSVFYTLDGALPGELREADLPGYGGARPVRVGNGARDQVQLSCYGDVLETAELFIRRGNHLDERTRDILALLADRCADEWERPDAGIWELDETRQYTISKIGCWLALDRAAGLAGDGHLPRERAGRWRREADRIASWIDDHCWSEGRQAYVMHAGADDLDASLLLATRFGFPREDRLDATRVAVQDELATGPLVHRYTGMPEVEGAFLACSFWLVEALAFLGHPDEARETMEALLSATDGDLGLMAEMVDVETGAFLGNLPQGLSHLAMIHAALSIQETAAGTPTAE